MANQSLKVYQAINAVQQAISKAGISKDRTATGFGSGYAFRGIDDVYNAISPLLAEHNLVILPRCLERIESTRQSGPKTLYFVVVKMEYDFISSVDGSKHVACVYGEAMDSGDKATNKAMSIAYKYACFQTFAIPTEGDNDPDATVYAPGNAQAKPQQHAGQQNQQQNRQQSQNRQQAQNKPQSNANTQTQLQMRPVEELLTGINKAATVADLGKIRDYVTARPYTGKDAELIKGQLLSRHSTITQAAQANYS